MSVEKEPRYDRVQLSHILTPYSHGTTTATLKASKAEALYYFFLSSHLNTASVLLSWQLTTVLLAHSKHTRIQKCCQIRFEGNAKNVIISSMDGIGQTHVV